jgi:hypothetical protein
MEVAQEYTGIKKKSALIQIALTRLIAGEAGMRLAAMGGTMPNSKEVPRRRSPGK